MRDWSLALQVGQDTSLTHFSALLHSARVAHRISEAGGEQLLWVADEATAEQVRQMYQDYLDNPQLQALEPIVLQPPVQPSFWQQLGKLPVVALTLGLTLLVALWTQLGSAIEAVAWLSFNPLVIRPDGAYLLPLAYGLEQGQWWRLVSPMLLHFGWLHLAMNMLWYWELGRRIERHQGAWFLLLFTLLSGLLSNLSQFLYSGPSLFGGLSGVLYALLGFCWMYQRIHPVAAYSLPKGVVGMMLVWLVICLTGITAAVGFGEIANAAHVSGLLAGCLAGLVLGFRARKNTRTDN